MRGNSHVRFGAGDEETCPGNGARRFIPTLLTNRPALFLSLSAASALTTGYEAVERNRRLRVRDGARRVKTRRGRGFSAADSPVPEGDAQYDARFGVAVPAERSAWSHGQKLDQFADRRSTIFLHTHAGAGLTLARRPHESWSARRRF
jgi:hypothetical protein